MIISISKNFILIRFSSKVINYISTVKDSLEVYSQNKQLKGNLSFRFTE